MIGYINLHRKLIEWEWYDDHKTTRLFIHLLLIASHKPHNYRGVLIQTGQVMTGYEKLAKDVGLSIQNVRTSLKRLKSTSELTIKTSSQGTIIQIVNYSKYQTPTSKLTASQQASNKQVTTINNGNNDNNKTFEGFWKVYDKKVNKDKALKLFNKLTDKEIDLIRNHLGDYVKSTPIKKYRKSPDTYLRNKCWNDEIIEPKQIIKNDRL